MKKEKIKCFIVDDEEMATKVIKAHLKHIPDFEIVGIYHSAIEAFLALESTEVQVLFLDIQMPKLTGVELLTMLKQKPLTVLTTAHREYALESYELEVVDYLLKPIGLNRFLQTISRLKNRLHLTSGTQERLRSTSEIEPTQITPNRSKHIFVKTNRAYQKIDFDEILHIEVIKNHIKIVTKTTNHISLIALTEFEKQLPESFLRIHRSFIINTTNLLKFNTYSINHEKGEVPIGRTYKDRTLLTLQKLIEK